MKSSRHPSQSASASRRGSSKNRSSRSGGSGGKSNGSAKPAEPSFWQKIVSKLTGRSAAKPAASRSDSGRVSTHPANAAQRSKSSSGIDASPADRPASERTSSRKPEMVEVTTPRLYVGNLSFDASEGDLTELFKGVGQVVSVEVVSHKQTQRSKGFAFVQMQSVEEAKRAVMELHDKEFMNRKLVVSGAKNSDQHDGRSEPRFAA